MEETGVCEAGRRLAEKRYVGYTDPTFTFFAFLDPKQLFLVLR